MDTMSCYIMRCDATYCDARIALHHIASIRNAMNGMRWIRWMQCDGIAWELLSDSENGMNDQHSIHVIDNICIYFNISIVISIHTSIYLFVHVHQLLSAPEAPSA